MLEKYFKNTQEFQKHLDKTYDPGTFEKSFKQFLELLYKKESSAMNLPQFLIGSSQLWPPTKAGSLLGLLVSLID